MESLKVGDEARLYFVDHSTIADDGLFRFVARGRVYEITEEHVILDTWVYEDPKKERDQNVERFTLIRPVITKAEKLTRAVEVRI